MLLLCAGSVTAVEWEIFNCIIEISPYYQYQLLRCSMPWHFLTIINGQIAGMGMNKSIPPSQLTCLFIILMAST